MILQILDKALINTEQRLDSNERDQYVRPVRRVFIAVFGVVEEGNVKTVNFRRQG